MNKALELISDRKGKLSTSRLAFLLWSVGALGIWGYISYNNKTMSDVPEGVRWVFAVLAGNRVGQKYLEGKTLNEAIKPDAPKTP